MTLGNLERYSTCGISVSFREIAIFSTSLLLQQKWKKPYYFRKPYSLDGGEFQVINLNPKGPLALQY